MQERYNLSDQEVNRDILQFVMVTPPWFWIAAIILGALVALMMATLGYIVYEGLWVTGMDRPVMWAIFITNFVFWVGISHAGVMISAILRLTQAEWRRPISRAAEVMTVFALATSGLFAIIHTGRPWRTAYWLLPYDFDRGIFPAIRSPLLWDFSAILTYLIASSLVVYIGLIPDMALAHSHTAGWRRHFYGLLSFGFRGTARQWRIHVLGSILLAALALAIFVSVHSIVAWDFGMALVPGWHSSIFAPYFVIGAVHSGIAAVVITMALLLWGLRLDRYITRDHFDAIGRLMIAVALTWFYFYLTDAFFGLLTQDLQAIAVWELRLFTFPNNLIMVIFILCVFIIPVPLWLFRSIRRNPAAMFLTGILVNIGMWTERFMIIVPSLQYKQPFTFSWTAYTPSAVETILTLGSFALVALGILLFAKFFPIIPVFPEKEGQIVKADIKVGEREVPAVIRE